MSGGTSGIRIQARSRLNGRRTCNTCGQSKSIGSFSLQMSNGRLWRCVKCRVCTLAAARDTRKRYKQSPAGRAAKKRYVKSPAGRAAKKRYKQTPAGRAAKKRYKQSTGGRAARKRYYSSVHGRAASAARSAVFRALRSGKLVRPSICANCGGDGGNRVIESHHHKGYDQSVWLDVVWLCCSCHRAAEGVKGVKRS